MSRSMRILHIAPGEPFGGVQRIALSLAEAQSVADDVGVLWTGTAERAAAEMADGLVQCSQAKGPLLSRIQQARSEIRAFAPDIIHVHMPPPWLALALIGTSFSTCYHLHGAPQQDTGAKAWLGKAANCLIIGRSKALVAISTWIKEEWSRLYPRASYRCVYNGIPAGRGAGPVRILDARSKPVVGFGSRLAHDKGVNEFADFAEQLHQRIPAARFLVAGEGPERAWLERRLAHLIDAGLVDLKGHVSDMPAFWQSLDLAIFTAPKEPFGLRLIEPIAEGVPALAYETGFGSDEIVKNCAGIDSVTYPNSSALADLAVAILGDHAKREEMVRQGVVDLETSFSMKAMTAGIRGVYCDMLNGSLS